MKIAIIGTGAMGSVYAGLLADAGNEVWAVDSWRAHIDAIRDNGLRVEGASGDRVVRLAATTEAGDVGVCDLVIIATKAMQVEAAASSARALIGNDTTVLTIQNGLGSSEKVARVLGPEPVAIGVVGGFGASIRAPGHVHHNGWELVRLGEIDGPVTPRLEAIAEVWRGAGFRVRTFDDIHRMVWEKLICNVCFSGSCAITGWTTGEVMANDDAWRVASGCALEAYEVARAKGVAIDITEPVAYVRAFGSKIPDARPSMLLDHLEGRASEIDVINGAIPREAEALAMTAPYNEVVVALVKAKEAALGLR
ncbi:MAG: 2-dehydropantoate 2-reductase [Alphaproteobacteria bacterium]|jgi:2-dehydropantoate 2-reductase|nr:2-dehydropantoate 2-reductase [Alphaproteobacteria bacterium]